MIRYPPRAMNQRDRALLVCYLRRHGLSHSTIEAAKKRRCGYVSAEMKRVFLDRDTRNGEKWSIPCIGGEETQYSSVRTLHHRYAINFGSMPLRREQHEDLWSECQRTDPSTSTPERDSST